MSVRNHSDGITNAGIIAEKDAEIAHLGREVEKYKVYAELGAASVKYIGEVVERSVPEIEKLKAQLAQLTIENQHLKAEKGGIAERGLEMLQELNSTNSYDTIKEVYKFHEVFGHSLGNTEPTEDEINLRINLIFEELTELAEAFGDMGVVTMQTLCAIYSEKDIKAKPYNKVEVLDALCDLRYVTDGTVITAGLDGIFYDAFKLVQQSNMSKAAFAVKDIKATTKFYEKEKVDFVLNYKTIDGDQYGIFTRESDGKILKPTNYTAVDLTKLVESLD